MKTPSYVYDIDILKKRIEDIKSALHGIPLTFSVKANSFVLNAIRNDVVFMEVCSPGELHICKRMNIAPEQIIYSGVMKDRDDIREAIEYNAFLLTAESKTQFSRIISLAEEMNTCVNVLLRLSSDNQFGMDPEDIYKIVSQIEEYKNIRVYGLHYYSGTQKKKQNQIVSDIERLKEVIETCKTKYGYSPELVEYGPGLAVEYFQEDGDLSDITLLRTIAPIICEFSKSVPLGIEMGRFIAASCGSYYSTVRDLKTNYGINYAILDGGIHHLKYYGQIMAINAPLIVQHNKRESEKHKYCLCGSLCTVADVLVKEIELNELQIEDIIEFKKCGAYSLTESSSLFLSRDMPCIYLKVGESLKMVRGAVKSCEINTIGYHLSPDSNLTSL